MTMENGSNHSNDIRRTSVDFKQLLEVFPECPNFQGQIQPFKQWRWALFHIESTSNATSEAAKVAVGSSAQVHINQIKHMSLVGGQGPWSLGSITWILGEKGFPVDCDNPHRLYRFILMWNKKSPPISCQVQRPTTTTTGSWPLPCSEMESVTLATCHGIPKFEECLIIFGSWCNGCP